MIDIQVFSALKLFFIRPTSPQHLTCLCVVFFALFGSERDNRAGTGREGELFTMHGSISACDCVSSFSTAKGRGKTEPAGGTAVNDTDLGFSPFLRIFSA